MQELSSRNHLLAALPAPMHEAVRADCTRIPLVRGVVLHEQDRSADHVILPESGVISMLTVMEDGGLVEAAIVGREGVAGYPLSAGGRSPWRTLVQIGGEALSLPLAAFHRHLSESTVLRSQLDAYAATLLVASAQSTACNRFHDLPQRLARWLLMTQDRVEEDVFPMTHELLAHMLGAHRPSVTLAVRPLQQAGLVEHRRGRMRILDRGGLEDASCECYARIRDWA